MKLSWTSLKISIAGAKLSHLVQKDKIWDHGSMTEQARIIFYLVQKAKANGNIESLKKQCSVSCFEKLKYEMTESGMDIKTDNPIITEIAIIDVQPGKKNEPDMFCALIRGYLKEGQNHGFKNDYYKKFMAKWFFIRQGDWWVLNEIKT